MKKLLNMLFVCASLLFVAPIAAESCCNTNSTTNSGCCDCYCSSYFLPRSVGDNLVRQATYKNYVYGADSFHGDFSIDYRFQKSRKSENIATALFGAPSVQFVGSSNIGSITTTTNTNTCNTGCSTTPTVVLADNFGLSPATNQTITFNPQIKYNVVDFEVYLGFDEFCEGLFFQMNLPLATTTWRLGTCSNNNSTTTANNNNCCSSNCTTTDSSCCTGSNLPTPPTTTFNPGCMSSVRNEAGDAFNPITPATSFDAALGGNFLFGDMQTAWTAGRFNFCDQKRTDLASVNLILGYNVWECADYNLGIFLRAAAPMRTQDRCCTTSTFFSPKIGDSFWKLGAGLTGHAELYNCNDEHFVNLYIEGYAEHMFSRCQVRSFDFANKGCLSRYMLLKEFTAATGTLDTQLYADNLINGINFATRSINVGIACQGEGILELVYNNDCGFQASLGYNIYGHTREKGCNIGAPCDPTLNNRFFGFKGCAPVQAAGYVITTAVACPLTITVPADVADLVTYTLNSTQSNATMRACGDVDNAQIPTTGLYVACVDGATNGFIYANTCANNVANFENDVTTIAAIQAAGVAFDSSSTNIALAIDGAVTNFTPAPVIIDPTAATTFNIQSGLAGSQITNKVFGHIDYAWTDCDWSPALYVGGSVEFASNSRCAGMNAWDVFVGGNIAF